MAQNANEPVRDDRPEGAAAIEHLVTWQEDGGRVVVVGLDAACRPVYMTTLYSYR